MPPHCGGPTLAARAHEHTHGEQDMRITPGFAQKLAAAFAAVALTTSFAGTALAHPESEGGHAGSCIVTVEPGTVALGQRFIVAGNFGGASIFVAPGADGAVGEDADADATTPLGSSFSVELTADRAGTFRVWGLIEGSECGDSDTLVVSALPDTAAEPPTVSIGAVLLMAVVLFALPAYIGFARLMRSRR
ncbi:MAG TPA: hypothetical protein VFN76_01405 [Candidatus Limnocylindria bacterium]|nr:hypothetical protein [Candidatus Limnocylindria bacterium]